MSRRYEVIDLETSNSVRALRSQIHRPLILSGNGPSVSAIAYNRIPENPVIFRTNCFFWEQDYFLGKRVDAHFMSIYRDVLLDDLYCSLKQGLYHIDHFFFPINFDKQEPDRALINRACEELFRPNGDHWNLLATVPEYARAMICRPLPTLGLQTLAAATVLGFRQIYLVGVDFYYSNRERYAFEIDQDIKKRMRSCDFKPGYEAGSHSRDVDLWFLEVIRKSTPDLKLFSLSEQSFASTLIPMAPAVGGTSIRRSPKPSIDRSQSLVSRSLPASGESGLMRMFKKCVLGVSRALLKAITKAPFGETALRVIGRQIQTIQSDDR